MFFSSWRKLVQQVRRQGGKVRRGRRQPAENRKSTWLWCEQLEERTLLTTFQWTGGITGTDNNWNSVLNWNVPGSGTGVGFPSAAGDIAQFIGNVQAGNIKINANVTVGEIDFNSNSTFTI